MRLIDADDLKTKIMIDAPDFMNGGSSITKAFIMAMLGSRAATPTIDAVPVVRCKDCKYWKQWDSTTHYLCTYVAGAKFIRNADDFCSRGERREP